jgi:hypothetical protein
VRVYNVKLRSSSAPGIVTGSFVVPEIALWPALRNTVKIGGGDGADIGSRADSNAHESLLDYAPFRRTTLDCIPVFLPPPYVHLRWITIDHVENVG